MGLRFVCSPVGLSRYARIVVLVRRNRYRDGALEAYSLAPLSGSTWIELQWNKGCTVERARSENEPAAPVSTRTKGVVACLQLPAEGELHEKIYFFTP
jgi:hypothetical protein